jgi:hypothetical protein
MISNPRPVGMPSRPSLYHPAVVLGPWVRTEVGERSQMLRLQMGLGIRGCQNNYERNNSGYSNEQSIWINMIMSCEWLCRVSNALAVSMTTMSAKNDKSFDDERLKNYTKNITTNRINNIPLLLNASTMEAAIARSRWHPTPII